MAVKGKALDSFANKMYGRVIESAANTLTFSEIQTNVNFSERIAFIIHRIEWFIDRAQLLKILDGVDEINFAMVASQNITTLGLDNPAVIDRFQIAKFQASDVGFELTQKPFIRNFSDLPGGGILVSPRPLFLAVQGVSLASAVTVEARAYYTVKELDDASYADLIDFYRILQ